jgi:hypothetical protein
MADGGGRGERPKPNAARLVAINLLVFAALLVAIEIAARVAIRLTRGSATAGLQERTLNLDYEPFVMYGPGWDGRLAAVPHDDRPTVMLVGGSTGEGFPPPVLEAALARRFGTPVRVVNAAYGGYEARQEVVVASLWAPSLHPAAIISLDGQNDLEHRLRVAAPGAFFLNASYRTYLTRPFAAPFAWALSQSQAYNALVRLQARRRVGDTNAYADAIPIYAAALHSINVLARGLGAARLMVLQPFVAFKHPQAPEERAFTAYAYREPVMRSLYDRAAAALADLSHRDGVAFLDARPLYDGHAAPLFTDDVHFRSVEGYEILARAIASALPADALSRPRP